MGQQQGQIGQTNSGALQPTADFIKALRLDEQCKIANLVDEFKQRRADIETRTNQAANEYALVALMAARNRGKGNIEQQVQLQEALAKINFNQIMDGISLVGYRGQLGQAKTIRIISEVMYFFITQLKIKEGMTEADIQPLAVELLVFHPHMKLNELILVLRHGTSGKYGNTFNRLDREVFWGWFGQHFKHMASWYEARHSNSSPDATRGYLGDSPEQAMEKRLHLFEQEQESRQKIYEASKEKASRQADFNERQLKKKAANLANLFDVSRKQTQDFET